MKSKHTHTPAAFDDQICTELYQVVYSGDATLI